MSMLRLNNLKKGTPSVDHNRDSWMRIVYALYQYNGLASTTMLAGAINHKPPRASRRATQMDTNVAFVDYCLKNEWLRITR